MSCCYACDPCSNDSWRAGDFRHCRLRFHALLARIHRLTSPHARLPRRGDLSCLACLIYWPVRRTIFPRLDEPLLQHAKGGRVIIMSGYCVVTADGIRARFFCLERTPLPEVDGGPFLAEEPEALINTEADMPGRELFSDTKTGRNAGNGMAHSYDDHRTQHMEEIKRRFAKLVVDEALRLAERRKPKILVLAAEKQMLGYLRTAMHTLPKAPVAAGTAAAPRLGRRGTGATPAGGELRDSSASVSRHSASDVE